MHKLSITKFRLPNWKLIVLTGLLCVSVARSAYAVPFFGSQVTGSAAGSCPGASDAYIVEEVTTYVFGIAVSKSYRVHTASGEPTSDPCNLIGAYQEHMGGGNME